MMIMSESDTIPRRDGYIVPGGAIVERGDVEDLIRREPISETILKNNFPYAEEYVDGVLLELKEAGRIEYRDDRIVWKRV